MFASSSTKTALLRASSYLQPLSSSRRTFVYSCAAATQPQTVQTSSPSPASILIPREKLVDEWAERMSQFGDKYRLPRSVQAVYLKPLKRKPEYGVPTCDLQLRSFSVRNVEFMADFALRAAYYLRLPASGPVPLPKRTERWTVIRSNFAHKKSQENFERLTHRRLIQIQDGNVEVVQAWLAFLRKHAFHGVGMKANIWEFSSMDVGKLMADASSTVQESVASDLDGFGVSSNATGASSSVNDYLDKERFGHLTAPLAKARTE